MSLMVKDLTTRFIGRLRARDPAAWFELWEIFGPVLRAQFGKWGQGRIGFETVQDLSQETLAALSDAIDRHDPTKGARFSTWLLAIAKHTFTGELDRRTALKRGGGKKPAELDEARWSAGDELGPRDEYEAMIFRAKVEAAIRMVEKACDFFDFQIYRMRVFDGMSGKQVAAALGTSEPTVSRRMAKVRAELRACLADVMATYSFTDDERAEADRNGLSLSPNKGDDALFDEAIAEIYHRQVRLRERTRT